MLQQHHSRTSTSSIFTSEMAWEQPPGRLLQQAVVDGVADGGGAVIKWAGRCYGHCGRVLLMAFWINRDKVPRPVSVPFTQASCCSVAAARWAASFVKPAQPTSGSRWKRNPATTDPFFKSSLMKIIKRWPRTLPRCVTDEWGTDPRLQTAWQHQWLPDINW